MTHPPALTAPILTPAWTDDALCAQTGYGAADEWYPERGESYTAALKLCQGCPVRQECLEFAMTNEASDYHRHGIYGGATPRQRRRIAAERAKEAA